MGMGLGTYPLSDPARDHHIGDPDGDCHPHRARADRRYPEPGFCRGIARQGLARNPCLPSRHQERRADRDGSDGTSTGIHARRFDPDRNRVLVAGLGAITQFCNFPARSAAVARHDPGAGAVLRIPQSGGRYRAGFDRSTHQTELTVSISPTSAISDAALQAGPTAKARGYWATVGRRIARDKVSMVCAFILALIFLSALLAPWLGLADPYQGSMIRRLRHIGTPNYPLGTDELGRDMLARLIYGGRLSLLIGILPVILGFVIGTSLGLIAGYVGGKINTAIMRTIDVFYAFPSVLLAIAISGVLGAGIVNSIVSLTVVFVPQITRVAESVTTGVRNMDFVEAARASGAGPFTIMRVHMLGNVLGPIFVYATGLISVSMILAAGLSFLGLGTKPPEPAWGLMLNTLRTAIYINPWVAALPGAMIFAVSICFNLLSDGMRSAMDIRN